MKPGDLVRVRVPLDAHPFDDYKHGMLVMILGEGTVRAGNGEYIKCLGDKIRMFPTRWLEEMT